MAVQVALGVLASPGPDGLIASQSWHWPVAHSRLLFVLNIIEPTVTNNSALRGLGFCDKLAALAAKGH